MPQTPLPTKSQCFYLCIHTAAAYDIPKARMKQRNTCDKSRYSRDGITCVHDVKETIKIEGKTFLREKESQNINAWDPNDCPAVCVHPAVEYATEQSPHSSKAWRPAAIYRRSSNITERERRQNLAQLVKKNQRRYRKDKNKKEEQSKRSFCIHVGMKR